MTLSSIPNARSLLIGVLVTLASHLDMTLRQGFSIVGTTLTLLLGLPIAFLFLISLLVTEPWKSPRWLNRNQMAQDTNVAVGPSRSSKQSLPGL